MKLENTIKQQIKMDKELIKQIVLNTYSEIIIEAGKDIPAELNLEIELMGPNSPLDSIDLVSFIVALEEIFQDKHDFNVTLTDDEALNQDVSPFKNLNSLILYIVTFLR